MRFVATLWKKVEGGGGEGGGALLSIRVQAATECTFLPFPAPYDLWGRGVSRTHLCCFLLQQPATDRTNVQPGEEPCSVDTPPLSPRHDICSG